MKINGWTLIIFMIFTVSGCTTVTVYKNPLNELSSAITKTKSAVEMVSQETNKLATANRADAAALATERFGTAELGQVVPQGYIRAKVDSLELIRKLAVRLLEVVDSDSGSQAALAVEGVGTRSQALAVKLQNSSMAAFSAPLGKLGAVVTRIYDSHKREVILEEGIRDGVPPAKKLIALLKKEFADGAITDVSGALKDELEADRTNKIDSYDRLLKSHLLLSEEQRVKPELVALRINSINQIIKANNALQAFDSHLILSVLDELDSSLDKLAVAVANNNRPKELAAFAAEVSNFSASASELIDSVRLIGQAANQE